MVVVWLAGAGLKPAPTDWPAVWWGCGPNWVDCSFLGVLRCWSVVWKEHFAD